MTGNSGTITREADLTGALNGWVFPTSIAIGPPGTCSVSNSSNRRMPGPGSEFEAVAKFIRDLLAHRWVKTRQVRERENPKRIYYLSMEFLIGRTLTNNIINLMAEPLLQQALAREGIDHRLLAELEPDAGLGNGGPGPAGGLLHRFAGHAAILRDRLRAALRVRHLPAGAPNGYQVEQPDNWLRRPDPWEVARPGKTIKVPLNATFQHARRPHAAHRPASPPPAGHGLRSARRRLRR